jgi:hypothetical protein
MANWAVAISLLAETVERVAHAPSVKIATSRTNVQANRPVRKEVSIISHSP